jgi:AraC family transcriptional regulator
MNSAPASCLVTYDSELFTQAPLATSAAQAWPGLRVEHYQLPAMELPAHFHLHHLLLLHQPLVPVLARRRQGRHLEATAFQAGDAGLYPGGEYGAVTWEGLLDTTHLYLDNEYLEKLAGQRLDRTTFSLHNRFQFADPFLTQVGRQLLAAVTTPPALGQPYVESLTQVLMYHLLEHYATPAPRVTSGAQLPVAVLHRIDEYLAAHASQPVTLAALASLANLSVFQFARRFKLTLGIPPYQYVLGWKMRRAQQLLQTGTAPMATISDALGFTTPARFAEAFRRAVGCSPREYTSKR